MYIFRFWSRFISVTLLSASLGLGTARGSTIDRIDVQLNGGTPLVYTPADGAFSPIYWVSFPNAVYIAFLGNTLGIFSTYAFDAPGDAPLSPGVYTGATRFPFQSSADPGLDIDLNGFGANTSTGEFTIFEAIYAPNGHIQNFGAAFTENSYGATFTGDVYYNFDPDLAVPEPSTLALLLLSVPMSVQFLRRKNAVPHA